jgi:NTP pyrophosphatase (non-canonical NTP hydrolase)
MHNSIEYLQKVIHDTNKSKGFYDFEDAIGEKILDANILSPQHTETLKASIIARRLNSLISESAEAIEALRNNRRADIEKFENAMMDGGEYEVEFKKHVKDTFEDELADIAIWLFDLAEYCKVDLSGHILSKLKYNATRPIRHGKEF